VWDRLALHADRQVHPSGQSPMTAALPGAGGPTFRGRPVDIVIDVRSRLEHWMGHLPGSVCIPADAIAERLPRHPGVTHDSRILVFCASGARSAAAASELRSLGYRNVINGGAMSAAAAEYAR
jgi:rhodanese-related sulfurtransferase